MPHKCVKSACKIYTKLKELSQKPNHSFCSMVL